MARYFYTKRGFFIEETRYNPKIVGDINKPGSILAFRAHLISLENTSFVSTHQEITGISYAKENIVAKGYIIEPETIRDQKITIYGTTVERIDNIGIYPTKEKLSYLEIDEEHRYIKKDIVENPLYIIKSNDDLELEDDSTIVVKIFDVNTLDSLLGKSFNQIY